MLVLDKKKGEGYSSKKRDSVQVTWVELENRSTCHMGQVSNLEMHTSRRKYS